MRGFTLIETLVYLTLFAIVIGGGMVAVYQIIQSTDATSNKVIVQEEANFLLRKIDWALTGATSITSLTDGIATNTLTLTKNSTVLTFILSTGNLTLQEGGGMALPLNSSDVSVSAVAPATTLFKRTIVAGQPDSITAAFTLTSVLSGRNDKEDFSITKYLRK